MADKTTLAEKIAKASAIVGGKLKADAKNTEQRYDYISADKILSVCGQALAQVGVTVFPAIVADTVDVFDRGQGKFRYDAAVTFHMHVSDGETSLELPWVGRGSDYTVPDKALYKAITSGHKYFMAKLFAIGEGNEDSEHELSEDATPVQQPQRQQRAQRQQAQPAQPQPPTQPATNGSQPSWATKPDSLLFANEPYDFSGPEEAWDWGMAMGVFEAMPHCKNAYNKLKADHKPTKPSEMWQLWINDVTRRVNEKKEAA